VQTVLLLARAFASVRDVVQAEEVLRQAAVARPEKVMLFSALGEVLEQQGDTRRAEAIGHYRTARSLRNHLGIALSGALLRAGRPAQAEEVLQDLVLRQPKNAAFHYHLGIVLYEQKKVGQAETAFLAAIALELGYAEVHYSLGVIEMYRQKYGRAAAHFRKATELNGEFALAHGNLGDAEAARGKLDEAEAAFLRAIALEPDLAPAHANLGEVLLRRKQFAKAESHLRKAVALKLDVAVVHYHLGLVLRLQQKHREAEAPLQKAIELEPHHAEALAALGNLLSTQARHNEAEACYRKLIACRPDRPETYQDLGNALFEQGRRAEAEASYRKALALKPDSGMARYYLGCVLLQQARFDEATASFEKAIDLLPEKDTSREQARRLRQLSKRFAALDARLPAILRGTDKPAGAGEQLELARLCMLKGLYATAARFCRDAFTAEPKFAEDVPTSNRFAAACVAALAGCGKGKDADEVDDEQRALWRRQALEWLRQDLTWWGKVVEKGNAQTNAQVRLRMRSWQTTANLAGVRDKVGLARLPGEERKQWQRLWSDVDALLRRAGEPE
jgi:tetratricopeptide (TPR) repeat protein